MTISEMKKLRNHLMPHFIENYTVMKLGSQGLKAKMTHGTLSFCVSLSVFIT